jgi:sialic acid synthase
MTYIIAEIGQNHNGSVDIAKLLTEIASRQVSDPLFNTTNKGFDAVKMTKRDLSEELSKSQMQAPYSSIHSFGKTYGEHRRFLELSNEEHHEVYQFAKSKGMDFIETLCSVKCLSILKLFSPDKLKVASRDLTNLPLLKEMAKTKIPIIISTGMAGKRELDNAINAIAKEHENLSILHCVSQYPTEYKNVNLNTIPYLIEEYGESYTIGYSDHTIGVSTPLAAVSLGAEIIEKHITLDRKMKGSDQAGSLAIDGMSRMVRDIRNLEASFGKKDIFIDAAVVGAKTKLERSIATKKKIIKGEKITADKLHLLSPGDGFKWFDLSKVVGSIAKEEIDENEVIYPNQIA